MLQQDIYARCDELQRCILLPQQKPSLRTSGLILIPTAARNTSLIEIAPA